jgi:catechol 2,3-dioxygenase-like lactoylglutathione lyase family enzyme
LSESPPAWLAKDCLDVGVFTNNLAPMLEFWQTQCGLTFDHLLPVGGGIHQHRHDHLGSVFKLNHSRTALSRRPPAGYLKLYVAKPGIATIIELVDPDGNQVVLVPVGHAGIGQLAIATQPFK